jgi:activator of HSP90 ATPase
MNATPAQVWRALTDPKVIRKWSGAEAVFPTEAVAEYSLWDGSIVGRVLEMEPHERLVQTWEPENWMTEDSVATFTLTPVGKRTRVDLVHINVEDWDYVGTNAGWDIYYLGAIKRMFDTKAAKERKAAKKAAAKKAETRRAAKTRKGVARRKKAA